MMIFSIPTTIIIVLIGLLLYAFFVRVTHLTMLSKKDKREGIARFPSIVHIGGLDAPRGCKCHSIKQKIGIHGLRKTMAYQYITNAPDKSQALLEVASQLGHSDPRITERYACLEQKDIEDGNQRMSFICDK
ncbi:hypothetical protein [Lacrimispora sp.]|uniref:hypothetical protein n=1 Tax=Lacrimispora sp. TaxID=2719234 RepID=UPI00289D0EAD|nr:hypothetical protein [Lacrimispora sp.]